MRKVIFTCDICGTEKKASNGWTLGFVENNRVIFAKWNDGTAPTYKHLCGSDCEIKFLLAITSTWRQNLSTRRVKFVSSPSLINPEQYDDGDEEIENPW